jgi:ribosomal protein L27
MIVAKITPQAKKLIQVSPYKTEEITADYMVVIVQKFIVGSIVGSFNDDSIFEVHFGNIKYEKKPDGTQGNPMLDKVISQRLKLNSSDLANWGTDDSVVMDIVARKLGVTIVEKTVMDMQHTA